MATHRVRVFAILIALGAGSTVAFAGPAPGFIGLGDLPGGHYISLAGAISGDGLSVVGCSGSSPPGYSNGDEPFRWRANTGMSGLGSLNPAGNIFGCANGISYDGSVVVGWSKAGTTTQAFRWTSATGMQSLGQIVDEIAGSNALGMSADGSVIVGHAVAADGAYEPMRWTQDEGMTSLGRLSPNIGGSATATSNDGSVIVGYSGSQAYRWTQADGMMPLGDLPGGLIDSGALDTTADGSVIVGWGSTQYGEQATRWTANSGWTALPRLLSESVACAVSADGEIVVGYSSPNGSLLNGVATLWDAQGAHSIQDLLQDDLGLDLSGWSLTKATGISDDGRTITGWGRNPSGDTEAWIAVIPEPTTAFMLATGSLFIFRKVRKPAQ